MKLNENSPLTFVSSQPSYFILADKLMLSKLYPEASLSASKSNEMVKTRAGA